MIKRVFGVMSLVALLSVTPLHAIPLPFGLMRDPFDADSVSVSPSLNSHSVVAIPLVKLTGVVWDPQDPYAVFIYKGIRRIVSTGDSLDSWQVLLITAKSVSLKSKDRVIGLKVGQEMKL